MCLNWCDEAMDLLQLTDWLSLSPAILSSRCFTRQRLPGAGLAVKERQSKGATIPLIENVVEKVTRLLLQYGR